MIKKIMILGASGEGKCVADFIADINDKCGSAVYELLGFLDDSYSSQGRQYYGYPILGPLSIAASQSDVYFINAIGSYKKPALRQSVFQRLNVPLNRYQTLIHPLAYVSKSAKIGLGCIIYPNVTIGPSVDLGSQVLVLFGANISHDTKIGDFTIVAGGVQISGFCNIDENCYFGTGASLRERVRVGNEVVLGMGAVATKDLLEKGSYVGIPAKFLTSI